MYLFISSSDNTTIRMSLFSKNKILKKLVLSEQPPSRKKMLPLLDSIMKIMKIHLEQLRGIVVVAGPGGFSSLRSGIAIANALGWAMKKPLIGVMADEVPEKESEFLPFMFKKLKSARLGEMVLPRYGKKPNITHSQKV